MILKLAPSHRAPSKEPLEVGADLIDRFLESPPERFGEAAIRKRDVSGVVERFVVLCFKPVTIQLRRRAEVRGVGFHQKPLPGNVPEHFALGGFPRMQEGRGERKEGPAPHKARDHFTRSGVGVQEKAACGQGVVSEDFPKGAPGPDAVERGGTLQFGGEPELEEENVSLGGFVARFNPSIQSDLAHAGLGKLVQETA